MKTTRRLWIALAVVLAGTFLILGLFGREVYRKAPPIPARVMTESGREITTREDILDGQQVWQSIGGQQVGSVWGHGAYQAPDWSADWLHREATALLEIYSQEQFQRPIAHVTPEQAAGLKERLQRALRTNTFDPERDVLTVSDDRAEAMAQTARHYVMLFGGAPELAALRESRTPDIRKRFLL